MLSKILFREHPDWYAVYCHPAMEEAIRKAIADCAKAPEVWCSEAIDENKVLIGQNASHPDSPLNEDNIRRRWDNIGHGVLYADRGPDRVGGHPSTGVVRSGRRGIGG